MSAPSLKAIATILNRRAQAHPVGRLQEIRAKLHQRQRAGRDIFTSTTTFRKWAFHFGGRSELQFNIGFEDDSGSRELRHGVAFSFNRTQALQRPLELLRPKVKLFNRFMELHSYRYEDMHMWHWHGERSPDYRPRRIPPKLVTEGVFVFLGKRQRRDHIDYEIILDDFDRLLDLYEFTERCDQSPTVSVPIEVEFRPGFKPKASSAMAAQIREQWQVILRHNKLQEALCRRLVEQHGAKNVSAELSNALRTRADVVVKRGTGYWYYEIKTARSARECLREALGQLLEYAFWPGSLSATRLIVLGEGVMDQPCEKYLSVLRKRFSIPVEYQRIVLE